MEKGLGSWWSLTQPCKVRQTQLVTQSQSGSQLPEHHHLEESQTASSAQVDIRAIPYVIKGLHLGLYGMKCAVAFVGFFFFDISMSSYKICFIMSW